MELLAIDSGGVVSTIRNNQSFPMEVLRDPFVVDNRQSIVYYVDSNNLMRINLNIPNSAEVSHILLTVYMYVHGMCIEPFA